MISYAIMYISLLMIVTSLLAVEWRSLPEAVYTYQVQSVLIALVFALYAYSLNNPALYYWSGTALVSKGIAVPWLLRRYVLRVHSKETPPLLSILPSQVLGIAAALLAFGWAFKHHSDLVLLPSLAGEPYRMNSAVAAAVLILGFYALLTRRDAFKIVIGLCLLENGVHMGLISLAPSIPETALIGVVTDVVVSVGMLLYIVTGIYRSAGSLDTSHIAQLRG
ncbi:MAG: NADH-ubiquinone oxidoreductase, chain [Acidobacteria bacterium]|jgi:hydrogenase-4 component E|nr:NADH-ubiquinone oxidoreductase, chain [Acidobacteriota bacterium]